jgi:hypothetical protein
MKYLKKYSKILELHRADFDDHWDDIQKRDKEILDEMKDYVLDLEDDGLNVELSDSEDYSRYSFFYVRLVTHGEKPLILTQNIIDTLSHIDTIPEIKFAYISMKQIEEDGRIFNKYDYDHYYPNDFESLSNKLLNKKFAHFQVIYTSKESNWNDDESMSPYGNIW